MERLVYIVLICSFIRQTINVNISLGYRKCLDEMDVRMSAFEVLPIYGWDNIRNTYGGKVIDTTYEQCKLTFNGKYLLPDNVYLIPRKMSKIQQYAELITNWQNYTSLTSKSLNIDAGLSFRGVEISGKYSDEYQSSKSKQVLEKTDFTRVQLRYTAYTVKLQPHARLDPSFKKSLMNIASSIQLNLTREAIYLSEILIRDFGTHYVSSVTAGAALVQEEYFKQTLDVNTEQKKRSVLASASANFFGIVHASFGRSTSVDTTMKNSYEKSITSSQVMAYGGSMYTFQDYSVNKWAEKLEDNLVAIDRTGDPLYFLINPETLPELPNDILMQVKNYVDRAIWKYYEYNVYRGCMKEDSPNFSYQANIEDGSCLEPASNLSFGGVYQMCQMTKSDAGDLCGSLSQRNPKTGEFSCPANYREVKLYTEDYRNSQTYRSCRKCGLFGWKRCCTSGTKWSFATLTVYWCVALEPVPKNSGYLFGGIFSSYIDNPITMDKSCPKTYTRRMIGSDLYVCLSDDYELSSRYSIPFAGFFSCSSGNPLTEKSRQPTNPASDDKLMTLKQYFKETGKITGTKACPQGYSQHLAGISQECSIYYCLMSGALNSDGIVPVQRPPFSDEPEYVSAIEQHVVYNMSTKQWEMHNAETMKLLSEKSAFPSDNLSASRIICAPILLMSVAVYISISFF